MISTRFRKLIWKYNYNNLKERIPNGMRKIVKIKKIKVKLLTKQIKIYEAYDLDNCKPNKITPIGPNWLLGKSNTKLNQSAVQVSEN